MTYTLVVLASVFVASLAAPNLVEWFEIEPAKKAESPHQPLLGKEQAQIAFKPNEEEFKDFKLQFSKIYETLEEENKRFNTFVSNLEYIQEHNKKYRMGQKSFYLGINHFADMELEEFVSYNGLDRSRVKTSDCRKFLEPNYLTLPKEVDWREKGYVTEVKDQGQCGSCWSFSATGSLEGQHFRQTGKLVSLSEQQLVDCSSDYGNNGCDGGLMDQAFDYIRDYGVESEDEYKYKAEDEKCHFEKREVKANCTGCEDVESGSEDNLQQAVASVGPISVAIDASHRSFQLYNGGVYDEEECSSKLLDHGVLCVGYGTDVEDGDYWLVKNSWSAKWGEKGYIKMARNKGNMCGIATQASFPDV